MRAGTTLAATPVDRRAGPRVGSRSRRAAFAATALLAGCATAGRDASMIYSATHAGGALSVVVARVTAADGRGDGRALLSGSEIWDMELGTPVQFGLGRPGRQPSSAFAYTPSAAAGAAGWFNRDLQPRRYFLRLRAANPAAEGGTRDFTFSVPAAGATYNIGTFRVTCDAPGATCRVGAEPADETALAAAMLATHNPAAGAPVARLARAYPPRLADLPGLPTPAVPQVRVDPRLWVAAIDWAAFTAAGNAPASAPPLPATAAEPIPGPRSEAPDWSSARMMSTSSSDPFTTIAAIAVTGGIILVAIPIVLIARAIAEDQRNRRTAEEARREAEALRAAALAQEQWNPCTAGIAATLAPENVERHLRTTLAPGREAGRRAALPGPWQATVTRVVFRHCGSTPDSHGVEVATRWTATRPGEAEPAFDAAYSRTVVGATPDNRLVHSTRPPWELPVATEAACRPLADYCGAAGAALLLQEVTRGVTEARDAIVAGR